MIEIKIMKKRLDIEEIGFLKGLISSGLGLEAIRKKFEEMYGRRLCRATIYNWKKPKLDAKNKLGRRKITTTDQDR